MDRTSLHARTHKYNEGGTLQKGGQKAPKFKKKSPIEENRKKKKRKKKAVSQE
jgi:hypothetical protein